MELNDQIRAWLDSSDKDFYTGLSLLQKVSRNKVLVMNLGKKQNHKHLDKINYELSNYLKVNYQPIKPAEPIKVAKEKPIETKPIEKTEFDFNSLPDPVQKLFTQKRKFFMERNKLSQEVQDDTKDQTVIPKSVQEKVKCILELDEFIKAVDSKIEHYWKYGSLPVKHDEKPDQEQRKNSIAEIKKKINNQKTYVTKARQKFERHPENLRYAEDYQKKLHELKELIYQRDALSVQTSVEDADSA
jgi:hypothetical protein